jgi:hypothetical protein
VDPRNTEVYDLHIKVWLGFSTRVRFFRVRRKCRVEIQREDAPQKTLPVHREYWKRIRGLVDGAGFWRFPEQAHGSGLVLDGHLSILEVQHADRHHRVSCGNPMPHTRFGRLCQGLLDEAEILERLHEEQLAPGDLGELQRGVGVDVRTSLPWQWIMACRRDRALQACHADGKPPVRRARRNFTEQRLDAKLQAVLEFGCRRCKKGDEQLKWFYFQPPRRQVLRRLQEVAGWVVVCDTCHRQADFL